MFCFARLMIAAPLRVSSAPNGALAFRPSSTTTTTTTVPSRSCCRIRCSYAAPAAATGRRGATPYEELGLRAGATPREIKAAYRRLARERHPDVAGADVDAFVRLHRAYAALSDPDTRARYDLQAAAASVAGPRWTGSGSGSGRPRRTWETDQCW